MKYNGKRVFVKLEYEHAADCSTAEGEFTTDTESSTLGSIHNAEELVLSLEEPEDELSASGGFPSRPKSIPSLRGRSKHTAKVHPQAQNHR